MHGSLLLNTDAKLIVADTDRRTEHIWNGERIAYGKAIEIFAGDKVKFGAIDVELEFMAAEVKAPTGYLTGCTDRAFLRSENFSSQKKLRSSSLR